MASEAKLVAQAAEEVSEEQGKEAPAFYVYKDQRDTSVYTTLYEDVFHAAITCYKTLSKQTSEHVAALCDDDDSIVTHMMESFADAERQVFSDFQGCVMALNNAIRADDMDAFTHLLSAYETYEAPYREAFKTAVEREKEARGERKADPFHATFDAPDGAVNAPEQQGTVGRAHLRIVE